MKAWIEPEIVIRWWNPLSWLLRLLHRGWSVFYEATPHIGAWCDSSYRSKRGAQARAEQLNSAVGRAEAWIARTPREVGS